MTNLSIFFTKFSPVPSPSQFHEYLPIGGYKPFLHESIKLAFGAEADCIKENRVASVQSLSGTGACRLFAEFVRRYAPNATSYIPAVTWANHYAIWRDAGAQQKTYRYYKPEVRCTRGGWVTSLVFLGELRGILLLGARGRKENCLLSIHISVPSCFHEKKFKNCL